jgi:hypothetical protein
VRRPRVRAVRAVLETSQLDDRDVLSGPRTPVERDIKELTMHTTRQQSPDLLAPRHRRPASHRHFAQSSQNLNSEKLRWQPAIAHPRIYSAWAHLSPAAGLLPRFVRLFIRLGCLCEASVCLRTFHGSRVGEICFGREFPGDAPQALSFRCRHAKASFTDVTPQPRKMFKGCKTAVRLCS